MWYFRIFRGLYRETDIVSRDRDLFMITIGFIALIVAPLVLYYRLSTSSIKIVEYEHMVSEIVNGDDQYDKIKVRIRKEESIVYMILGIFFYFAAAYLRFPGYNMLSFVSMVTFIWNFQDWRDAVKSHRLIKKIKSYELV